MNTKVKNNLKEQLDWFAKNTQSALASNLQYSVAYKPQPNVKYEFVNINQRGSADLKVCHVLSSVTY
jgi:hypothetical protein